MSLFDKKAKPRPCSKCGVMFQPMAGKEWPTDLCQPHRDEARALRARKDAVAAWAATNWEALEPLSKLASPRYITTASGGTGCGGGGSDTQLLWLNQFHHGGIR